ncbi:MAG TPA: SIMPL domain-containing protein [Bryobacteraceae bacterium]|nr:SIMPL domain-containing protein [Bryobacteraceae bacterium]
MKRSILALVVALAGSYAWAQPAPPQRPASVQASGDAVVYAQPDQAKIDIGVVTQALTAEAAGQQNAKELKTVLDQLHALLGPSADIQTIGYSLTPNYQYPHPGGQAVLTGYRAMNTLRVMTSDLTGVGKIIDAATKSGANNIERLQFTLKNEGPSRAQALRQAAVEARNNAQSMATALGFKLGRVLSIEQGSAPVRPVMREMATFAAAATPVQPASIEVQAIVTLTVALEQ